MELRELFDSADLDEGGALELEEVSFISSNLIVYPRIR
jgi:hypothetical protein